MKIHLVRLGLIVAVNIVAWPLPLWRYVVVLALVLAIAKISEEME